MLREESDSRMSRIGVLEIELPFEVITEGDPEYPEEFVGTGATFHLHKNGLLELA